MTTWPAAKRSTPQANRGRDRVLVEACLMPVQDNSPL